MSEGQSPSSYGCRHSSGQYCMGLEHWGNTVVQLLEATYWVLTLDYLLSSRLGCIRMWGMRDDLKASSSDLEVAKRPTIAPAALLQLMLVPNYSAARSVYGRTACRPIQSPWGFTSSTSSTASIMSAKPEGDPSHPSGLPLGLLHPEASLCFFFQGLDWGTHEPVERHCTRPGAR